MLGALDVAFAGLAFGGVSSAGAPVGWRSRPIKDTPSSFFGAGFSVAGFTVAAPWPFAWPVRTTGGAEVCADAGSACSTGWLRQTMRPTTPTPSASATSAYGQRERRARTRSGIGGRRSNAAGRRTCSVLEASGAAAGSLATPSKITFASRPDSRAAGTAAVLGGSKTSVA